MVAVPSGFIGQTVLYAFTKLIESGLKLGLCVDDVQPPADWITDLDAFWLKIVSGYHSSTKPPVELPVGGTVGVMLAGGIEPKGGSSSQQQGGETGSAGRSPCVVINIYCDGGVRVTGGG